MTSTPPSSYNLNLLSIPTPPCEDEDHEHAPVLAWRRAPNGELVGYGAQNDEGSISDLLRALSRLRDRSESLPEVVHAPTEEFAARLTARLAEFHLPVRVEVGQLAVAAEGEIEELFTQLLENQNPPFADSGVGKAVIRQLLSQALEFFDLAPWEVACEEQMFTLDLQLSGDSAAATGSYLACVGGMESGINGIEIYDSLQSFESFCAQVDTDDHAEDTAAAKPFVGWQLLLSFVPDQEANEGELAETRLLVPGLLEKEHCFRLERLDGTDGRVPLLPADLFIARAALKAVAELLQQDGELLDGELEEPAKREYRLAAEGIEGTARFTLPHPGTAWIAPGEFDDEDDEGDDEDEDEKEGAADEDQSSAEDDEDFELDEALLADMSRFLAARGSALGPTLEMVCHAFLMAGHALSSSVLDGDALEVLLFDKELAPTVIGPMSASDREILLGDLEAFSRFLLEARHISAFAARSITRRGELLRKRFIEAAIAAAPRRFVAGAGGAVPRPTDPCPCGSGKKYKKCCMPR